MYAFASRPVQRIILVPLMSSIIGVGFYSFFLKTFFHGGHTEWRQIQIAVALVAFAGGAAIAWFCRERGWDIRGMEAKTKLPVDPVNSKTRE